MKILKRNSTTFKYSEYLGKEEILKDGKHTGKFEVSYGRPKEYTGNISVPSGQSQQQMFGLDTVYTHVLLMDDPNTNIREDGVIEWKGDRYLVTAVRPSINVLNVALKHIRQAETD